MNLVLGLSPGKIAFYDPVSRMHFHLGNPVQAVPKGVDTKKLHQAVKFKTLFVLEGSFDAKEDKAKAENRQLSKILKLTNLPPRSAKEQKPRKKSPLQKQKKNLKLKSLPRKQRKQSLKKTLTR